MSKIKHMSYNGRKMEYAFDPIDKNNTLVFYNHEMYSYGHGIVTASSLYYFIDMIRIYEEFRQQHKVGYTPHEIAYIRKALR